MTVTGSAWGELSEIAPFEAGQLVTIGAQAGVGRAFVAVRWVASAAVESGLRVAMVSSGEPVEGVECLRIPGGRPVAVRDIRSEVAAWGAKPAALLVQEAELLGGCSSGGVFAELKQLAVDLGTCVVTTAGLPLRLAGEGPVLADLPGGGSVGAESDVVLFLRGVTGGVSRLVEAAVAKGGSGPVGSRVLLEV